MASLGAVGAFARTGDRALGTLTLVRSALGGNASGTGGSSVPTTGQIWPRGSKA